MDPSNNAGVKRTWSMSCFQNKRRDNSSLRGTAVLMCMLMLNSKVPHDFCACVWYLSLQSSRLRQTALHLLFLLEHYCCAINIQWTGRAVQVTLHNEKTKAASSKGGDHKQWVTNQEEITNTQKNSLEVNIDSSCSVRSDCDAGALSWDL